MKKLAGGAITKKRADRNKLDAYDTPFPLAKAVCRWLYGEFGSFSRFFEPAAGTGIFATAARVTGVIKQSSTVLLSDICPRPREDTTAWPVKEADFLDKSEVFPRDLYEPLIILTNPPFRLAQEFVERALTLCTNADDVAAFLLPLSFLGGQARHNLFNRQHPSHLVPIIGRPSFTGGGTGSQEYGLFVWAEQKTPDAMFSTRGEVCYEGIVWKEE